MILLILRALSAEGIFLMAMLQVESIVQVQVNLVRANFRQGWCDDKIMHEISDIATDPNAIRRNGRGGRTITDGTRNGIDIRVIQERNGDIVSGFPTNVPRNPR